MYVDIFSYIIINRINSIIYEYFIIIIWKISSYRRLDTLGGIIAWYIFKYTYKGKFKDILNYDKELVI